MNYVCNPMNLPYRYQFVTEGGATRAFREAADPSLVRFRGLYWLFPSMAAGFFTSADLADWAYHPFIGDMPETSYAPDVCALGDELIFCASESDKNSDFYRCRDPRFEAFSRAPGFAPLWDPKLFLDDDGRLYAYWGCSNERPLYGAELDPARLRPIGAPVELLRADFERYGYERRGEDHHPSDGDLRPWIEGAWMTKHGGRYYLQYAAPGTEFNVYADAVAESDSPLGPFARAASNPFSYQSGGFATGAGHGSTLQTPDGRCYHVASMRLSRNHMFERRLGLWPAGFDADGALFCDQRYGDWPRRADAAPWEGPEWMLLSYGKRAYAASGADAALAVNEDMTNWWSAAEGDAWLEVDLGAVCRVHAVQINFADGEIVPDEALPEGRYIDKFPRRTRYLLQGSLDGKDYFPIADRRGAQTDLPHELIVREAGFDCRYLRLSDFELPMGQPARVSGLRAFGRAQGAAPEMAKARAERTSPLDMRVEWRAAGAMGANVLWGVAPDKLYHSRLVYGANETNIGALTAGGAVYLRVDAFNECGVAEGEVFNL